MLHTGKASEEHIAQQCLIMMTIVLLLQAHSLLLPAGSLNLSAPEAPALVADSGSVLDGVKGIVESGLQDLTENSMSAVG